MFQPHAEDGEQFRRDLKRVNILGISGPGDSSPTVAPGRHHKRVSLILAVDKVGVSHRP